MNVQLFYRTVVATRSSHSRGGDLAVEWCTARGDIGTILAAYLIRGGLSVEVALRELRAVCPNVGGSSAQQVALHVFAARRG